MSIRVGMGVGLIRVNERLKQRKSEKCEMGFRTKLSASTALMPETAILALNYFIYLFTP